MLTLKKLRLINNLTQVQLAKLVEASYGQIRKLEAGKRKLTKEWAERIAPHLGVTAQELLFPSDLVECSTKKVLRKNTSSVPILLQLSNKEWIENFGDIWEIKKNTLSSFDSKYDKKLFAVKLLFALQKDLAKPSDLAMCMPITEGDIADLSNNDIVLTKIPLPNTSLVKCSFYRLHLKASSHELELHNCFVNAESEKIILDVNKTKDIVIVAKVCYFVRLPQ